MPTEADLTALRDIGGTANNHVWGTYATSGLVSSTNGRWFGSTINAEGLVAYYYSSTPNGLNIHSLKTFSGTLTLSPNQLREAGLSVRCVSN